MTAPQMVDLRSLVCNPVPTRDYPIKLACPLHNDPGASLAVYADHCYCYGACRRYFRRYESVALLTGAWNGKPETVEAAILAVRSKLSSMGTVQRGTTVSQPEKPLDKSLASTFHRYLLSSSEALGFFKTWRGLKEETIAEFNLGRSEERRVG